MLFKILSISLIFMGTQVYAQSPTNGGRIGSAAEEFFPPASKCLDLIKEGLFFSEFSILKKNERHPESKKFSRNQAVLYSYNEKTGKHIPVFVLVDGESVHVTTPRGRSKTNGINCSETSKRHTSTGSIAKSMHEVALMVDLKKPSLLDKKSMKIYEHNVEKVKKFKLELLKACSETNIPEISQSAKAALKKLNGGASSPVSSETKKTAK